MDGMMALKRMIEVEAMIPMEMFLVLKRGTMVLEGGQWCWRG